MNFSLIKGQTSKLRYVPIGLIFVYQKLISPLTFPSCRFFPTCSDYARLAIAKHGILRGGALSLIRICKCHPFHPGGHDPLE